MPQEKALNKTQEIRALLAQPKSTDIRELFKSPLQIGSLTLPATTELADGLVSAGRWSDIAYAFELGYDKVFSGWLDSSGYGTGKRSISEHLHIDEARKHFSTPKTKILLDKVVQDLANRTEAGAWDVWTAMKSDPAYEAQLFSPQLSAGFSLRKLLEAQYKNAGTPMPADLKAKAVAAAASTELWNVAGYEPQITSWGSISRSQSNWRAGPVHEMFVRGEYEAATEATQLLGVEEYGKSGRGPIDSALMSGWFEAVDGLAKHDPLSLIRPVKVAANEWGWIKDHTPLKAFMVDLANSSAGKNYGLRIRAAKGTHDVDHLGLEGIMEKWVGGAYDLAGTSAQKQQWTQEWSLFQKAASNETSKLCMFEALTIFEGMIDDAVERLGIAPKITSSFRSWMATPAYEKVINGGPSPIAERIRQDGLQARVKSTQRLSKLAGLNSAAHAHAAAPDPPDETTHPLISNLPIPLATKPAMGPAAAAHTGQATAGVDDLEKIDISIKLMTKRKAASGYDKVQTAVLGRAVAQSDPDATRRALKAGADPNGRVGATDRMLHRALSLPHPDTSKAIYELLLAAGADPALPDGAGRQPGSKAVAP